VSPVETLTAARVPDYKPATPFTLWLDAKAVATEPKQGTAPFEDKMANTPSAKKAVRKIERRTAVNRSRRSQMRTCIRKVEEALLSGDPGAAQTALRAAEPMVMRAAQKGILHKSTASRKISRLATRVNGLAQTPPA